MDYKRLIIEMLDMVESEKFLRQLYTIIIRHLKRVRN